MFIKNLSKTVFMVFLFSLSGLTLSAEPIDQLKALLAKNKEDSEALKAAITLLEQTSKAAVEAKSKPASKKGSADKAKAEVDKKQDSKIAALEVGILDDMNLTGDVLKLRVNAFPFKEISTGNEFYAPANAKARVKKDLGETVLVDFKKVKNRNKTGTLSFNPCSHDNEKSLENRDCKTKELISVRSDQQYSIARDDLDRFNFKRKGVVYGGLVVPFKYYLGGDKRISASSTVAPYVGVRGLFHKYGSHVTPVFSAGLGLVPVNKSTTGDDGKVTTTTDTKSALSVATGLVFTSEKNKSFTAGVLIGKDFLSTADRLSDPTVDKYWTSLYIGLNVGGKK